VANTAAQQQQQQPLNEPTIDEAIPYYHEFSDTKLSQEIRYE
jgi:hypothetical protein